MTDRSVWRWAFQRVGWDRRHRSNFVLAYLATILTMLFRPVRFARGTMLPDRWGRAVRWAGLHVAIAAVTASLLGSNRFYRYWAWSYSEKEGRATQPAEILFQPAPPESVALWLGQSTVAWGAILFAMVGLAATISFVLPGQLRSVKFAGIKLALYLSAAFPVVILCWSVIGAMYEVFTLPVLPSMVTKPDFHLAAITLSGGSPAPPWIVAIFGVLWIVGTCRHPYGLRHASRDTLVRFTIFGVGWIVLSWILLRPWILADLL